MTESEVMSQAISGGAIGIASLFGASILKILKRWANVLEIQESLMQKYIKHMESEERLLQEISESTSSMSSNLQDIRIGVLQKESRSVVHTGQNIGRS